VTAAALLRARVGPADVWCSGRAHGNVGDHVGDDPRDVATRRRMISDISLLRAPDEWVWLRQVHGAQVYDADSPRANGALPEADAAVTSVHGLPLAIVTADCAPVVLASDNAIAAVHAGHRGLVAGVVEAAVTRLRVVGRGEVRAFLGPCIRPAHYEFGASDLASLVEHFGPDVATSTSDGRPAFDIPRAVQLALARAGVYAFEDCGVDTAGSTEYFSYRRDGDTGRQVTIVMLP